MTQTGQEISVPKVAMAQMLVEGGCVGANLARAEQRIRQAGDAGCDMIVLPECLDFGWMHPAAKDGAMTIGEASARLREAAQRSGIWVVAGLTERDGDRLYNASVLIDRKGSLRLHHRKIGELQFAQEMYATGSRVEVCETEFGLVGIPICADLLGDSVVLGHALGAMGARMLLCPCAWAVEPNYDNAALPYGGNWRHSYTQLATRWHLTVLGVSNIGRVEGGPWDGYKCIGCSLAVGPGGVLLGHAPFGETCETMLIIDGEQLQVAG